MSVQFHKFSSLENHYNTKHIEKAVEYGFTTGGFVVTEKVDGANFSFWSIPGEPLKVASRTQFVDGTFFNCQPVIDRYREAVESFANAVRKYENDDGLVVVIYGELFSDSINRRVRYGSLDFCAFEVVTFFRTAPEFKTVKTLTEDVVDLFVVCSIPTAPILGRVETLQEALNIDHNFKSKVIEVEGENWAEGTVISPVTPRWFGNGSRFMIKKKTEAFTEKKAANKHIQVDLSEAAQACLTSLLCFNTESRVHSAISKVGQVEQNAFGKILGEVMRDILDDFQKDPECAWPEPSEHYTDTHHKLVMKRLNGEVAKTVRAVFLSHLTKDL